VDPISEIFVASRTENIWIAKDGSQLWFLGTKYQRTRKLEVGIGEAWAFTDPQGKDPRNFRFVPSVLHLVFKSRDETISSSSCIEATNPFVSEPE